MRSLFAKRCTDVVLGGLGLCAVTPVLVLIAGAVRRSMGSPVLFRQMRPGLHGKPFEILKFRTMRDAVDSEGNLLPDAERLTRVGRFLRATSLDELPELLNVIRGEMSLVGPRPLLMEYLDRYNDEERRRHDVKPGITGWAQINGRNDLAWSDKFAKDVWYVDNWSNLLDLDILLRTILITFRREGINHAGSATMPVFTGSDAESLDGDPRAPPA